MYTFLKRCLHFCPVFEKKKKFFKIFKLNISKNKLLFLKKKIKKKKKNNNKKNKKKNNLEDFFFFLNSAFNK